MPISSWRAGLRHTPAITLAGTSLLRVASVGLRSLLTIALAVWLEPSEMGVYGLVVATLVLTTYFYGLDFHTFTMREISTNQLADARLRIRDQFAMLLVIYVAGGAIAALLLSQFRLDPKLVLLVVPLAAAQHAGLEFFRILTRLGRAPAAMTSLLIRDAAWVPVCFLIKLTTGDLSLVGLLWCWLGGSVLSVIYGARLLTRWLPEAGNRPIDFAWLARGLRTGIRMLAGTISVVALFTVDRMIFAALAPAEALGAYVFFAMICFSVMGVFETAVLPHFWTPLLEAAKQEDIGARLEAERKLTHVCLVAGLTGGALVAIAVTILVPFLPHAAYAANIHLLYFIAAAYSLVTLTNIPHYRLYASRRDFLIVTANIIAFGVFLITTALIAIYDRSIAVPIALVLACATMFAIKWVMARRVVLPARA